MKKALACFAVVALTEVLLPSLGLCAKLSHIGMDGKALRDEEINAVALTAPEPGVHVQSSTMDCNIKTKSLSEAVKIQTVLATKSNDHVWLQCIGNSKTQGKNLNLITNRYFLGMKRSE